MGKEGNLDGVVRTVLLPAGSTVGWAWEKQQRISNDRRIICFFGLFRFILLTYNSGFTLMWNRWSSRKIQTVQISWENLNWQHHDRQGVVLLQYKSHGKILAAFWPGGQAGGWKDCFAEWWLGTDTMPMVGDLTRISTAWTCAMSLTRLPLKSLKMMNFLRWIVFLLWPESFWHPGTLWSFLGSEVDRKSSGPAPLSRFSKRWLKTVVGKKCCSETLYILKSCWWFRIITVSW